MTNKLKILPILLIIAAALFTSCGAGVSDRLTDAEVEAYENYIMSSYFMLRGDSSIDESRAAWDYTETVLFPTSATPTSATSKNYPEKGQSTTVTISTDESYGTNVYKVVNVTTYPNHDAITSTTETYYVKDTNSDGTYDATVDQICTSAGTADPLAREMFKTVYDDGTERDETIIANRDSTSGSYGTVHYAEFDIDGPLVFPNTEDPLTLGGGTFNTGGTEWSPGTTTDLSAWSSMVAYDQTIEYDFLFWTFSNHVIGTRYYTEDGTANTSVTYERVIATITANETFGDYTIWSSKLFKGRNKDYQDTAEGTVYTETVIRTRIEGNKWKQVKSSSQVYNEAGASVVTFNATYAEDENGVVTSSGAPVAVY